VLAVELDRIGAGDLVAAHDQQALRGVDDDLVGKGATDLHQRQGGEIVGRVLLPAENRQAELADHGMAELMRQGEDDIADEEDDQPLALVQRHVRDDPRLLGEGGGRLLDPRRKRLLGGRRPERRRKGQEHEGESGQFHRTAHRILPHRATKRATPSPQPQPGRHSGVPEVLGSAGATIPVRGTGFAEDSQADDLAIAGIHDEAQALPPFVGAVGEVGGAAPDDRRAHHVAADSKAACDLLWRDDPARRAVGARESAGAGQHDQGEGKRGRRRHEHEG
jgi:hypothetical protein